MHSSSKLLYLDTFHAHVSRYVHYIKENVTAEWKDVAYQLGFSRPDVTNIEDRNGDNKSRCRDVLEEWQKREGDAATIDVLMEALRELELMRVVDGLKSRFPELTGATAGPTGAQ
ncbi:uncharacterized protein [Branchiostoma lanceolatum]|uniref:uncharacterized protein n=1 Tax=Branchiostoma lanceolatum TaxID=7740 RepID=UPI003455BC23